MAQGQLKGDLCLSATITFCPECGKVEEDPQTKDWIQFFQCKT